jgi:hypothetical protein
LQFLIEAYLSEVLIHEFRHDDFGVSRLSTLRLLAGTDEMLRALHDHGLRNVRRKKIKWMKVNNANIQAVLDTYFDAVYRLVFDGKGHPRYPVAVRDERSRQ